MAHKKNPASVRQRLGGSPSHLLGGTNISPSRGFAIASARTPRSRQLELPDHVSKGVRHHVSKGVRGFDISPSRCWRHPSAHLHADESTITSARRYKSHLHAMTNPPCWRHSTSPNGTPKQGASRTPMMSARHLMTSGRDVTFSRTLLAAILDLAGGGGAG